MKGKTPKTYRDLVIRHVVTKLTVELADDNYTDPKKCTFKTEAHRNAAREFIKELWGLTGEME